MGGQASKVWSKAGLLAIGWCAVLLHAAILALVALRPEGMNLGFFNMLSVSGWLTAVLLLVAASFRPLENLGIVLVLRRMNAVMR